MIMKNGKVISDFGTEFWYKDDDLHREDGPAVIVNGGTTKEWWLNGVRHREGGPAFINKVTTSWWRNGLRHREDGPAIIKYNDYQEWYINGKKIQCSNNKEFLRIIKLKIFF